MDSFDVNKCLWKLSEGFSEQRKTPTSWSSNNSSDKAIASANILLMASWHAGSSKDNSRPDGFFVMKTR